MSKIRLGRMLTKGGDGLRSFADDTRGLHPPTHSPGNITKKASRPFLLRAPALQDCAPGNQGTSTSLLPASLYNSKILAHWDKQKQIGKDKQRRSQL